MILYVDRLSERERVDMSGASDLKEKSSDLFVHDASMVKLYNFVKIFIQPKSTMSR